MSMVGNTRFYMYHQDLLFHLRLAKIQCSLQTAAKARKLDSQVRSVENVTFEDKVPKALLRQRWK